MASLDLLPNYDDALEQQQCGLLQFGAMVASRQHHLGLSNLQHPPDAGDCLLLQRLFNEPPEFSSSQLVAVVFVLPNFKLLHVAKPSLQQLLAAGGLELLPIHRAAAFA